ARAAPFPVRTVRSLRGRSPSGGPGDGSGSRGGPGIGERRAGSAAGDRVRGRTLAGGDRSASARVGSAALGGIVGGAEPGGGGPRKPGHASRSFPLPVHRSGPPSRRVVMGYGQMKAAKTLFRTEKAR